MIIETPAEKIITLVHATVLPVLSGFFHRQPITLYDANDRPIFTPYTVTGDTVQVIK